MPHQCLEIPEIAHLICTQMGQPRECRQALASLALTSRTFSQPATQCLWEELDSLTPLFDAISPGLCAPRFELVLDMYRLVPRQRVGFTRPYTTQDHASLKALASRVLSLHVGMVDMAQYAKVLDMVRVSRPPADPPMFPKLQDLVLAGYEMPLEIMHLFLNPSLLSLSVIGFRNPTAFAETFARCCPKLTKLTVSDGYITCKEGDYNPIAFREWTSLKVVHLHPSDCPAEVLDGLSQLPLLEELSLNVPSVDVLKQPGFPSLRKLVLRGEAPSPEDEESHEASTILNFIKCLNNPPLESLVLEVEPEDSTWSLTSMYKIFELLPQHLRPAALTELVIKEIIYHTERFAISEEYWEHDDPFQIHHLHVFANLQHLRFELSVPVTIALEPLMTLSPTLRTLSLGLFVSDALEFLSPPTPRLKIQELVTLARHLPNLELIRTFLDASELQQGDAYLDTPFQQQSLRELWVGYSPISSPRDVGAFLLNLFPNIHDIMCWSDDLEHHYEEEESSFSVYKKWAEVKTSLALTEGSSDCMR